MTRWILLFSLLLGNSAQARLGNGASGGGKGVVCRDNREKVKSVELLDLWEARTLWGRKISPSKESVASQVKSAVARLKHAVALMPNFTVGGLSEPENLENTLSTVAELLGKPSPAVIRLRKSKLTLTDDSYEDAQPSDCSVEQIVTFQDAPELNRVLVNQDLLDKMDATNLAALYLHEGLYRYLRQELGGQIVPLERDKDSRRVRRAIGFVFSGGSFPALNATIEKNPIYCRSADSPFTENFSDVLFYRDADGIWRSVALVLFGRAMVGHFPSSKVASASHVSAFNNHGESPCDQEKIETTQVRLNGPTDFRSSYFLLQKCENNHVTIYIAPTPETQISEKTQKLDCSF